MGLEYWRGLVDFMESMARAGTIAAEDLKLIQVTDSVEEAIQHIREKAIEEKPELGTRYDVDIAYDADIMGPKDFLRDLGVKILRRWNKEAAQLLDRIGSEVVERAKSWHAKDDVALVHRQGQEVARQRRRSVSKCRHCERRSRHGRTSFTP